MARGYHVWLAAACVLALMGGSALAAPIKVVNEFDAFWGFDIPEPNFADNLDLYSNSTGAPGADGEGDFFHSLASPGVTGIQDGAFVYDVSGTRNNLIWAATNSITATTGYTVEYRIKIDSITNTRGIIFYATKPSAPVGAISFGLSPADAEVVTIHWEANVNASTIKATVPKSEFVIVRVTETFDAATSSRSYALYVNNELVEDNLPPNITSQAAIDFNLMPMGRASTGNGGVLRLDYVAFTAGAFAPVPEPALAGLCAGAGALMLSRRRRCRIAVRRESPAESRSR